MDLASLRYFKAVAETQNMSKAAKSLFVSQSALSKSIRALENELGGSLFQRTGKNLVLNDGGRILLRYATDILNQCSLMKTELSDYFGWEATTVSVSINIGTHLLTTVLPSFLDRHPQIQLQISQNDFSMPDRDNYDICINGTTEKPDDPNVVTLFDEELLLAVPHNHPLATAPAIFMRDIADEPFVLVRGQQLTEQTNAACQKAGFRPKVILHSDYPSTTLDLVELGIGICFLPEVTWSSAGRSGIVQRRITDAHMRRYISLSWRQSGYLSNGATQLKNYLLHYFLHVYPQEE